MPSSTVRLIRFCLPLLAGAIAAQGQTPESETATGAAPPEALYLTWQRDPLTTMTVHWHTDWMKGYRDTVLQFRPEAAIDAPWKEIRGQSRPMPFATRMIHTVELTGLSPDTVYAFRLGVLRTRGSGELVFVPDGAQHRFRTLPAALDRPVRFVAGGDANVGDNHAFGEINRAAAAHAPDFALIGGDIAYANDEPKAVGKWFEFMRIWSETMLAPDGRIVPIVPAIGNHEVHGDTFEVRGGAPHRGLSPERAAIFHGVFSFPGYSGYNVLDAGDYLSVIALDSSHTRPVAGEQTRWLRDVLERRRGVAWIVPFYHVPAYPSHRNYDGPVSAAVREHWVPLFEQARVRLAFENHDHAYKVTHPLRSGRPDPDGVRYLGDGAWAVEPRTTHPPEKAPYLERAQSRNHVFVVTLHPDRADVVAVDPAGEIFDRFSVALLGPRTDAASREGTRPVASSAGP